MPTFVGYESCAFADEASTQSMAIYTKIPPSKVMRCSFVMNDANEELQLSLNMPIAHYTAPMAEGLKVAIYTPSSPSWTPKCRVGWNGWHGGSGKDHDGSNGVKKAADVPRVPLSASLSDRTAVFEPWGVGGYVPIIGCSTPIAQRGARHFISINNTNDHEARVCIGVGTKEEHFRSFTTWIELKWSLALWHTWEWGLTRGSFVVIVALAVTFNVYIFALFVYGAQFHWCFFWLPAMPPRSITRSGAEVTFSFSDVSNPDCEFRSDWEYSSSSDSDCDTVKCTDHLECDQRDCAKSDQVLYAAGFIVLFWMSGVTVVWLVLFFNNCVDLGTWQSKDPKESNGSKLVGWDNVWSPVLYVYTLPVLAATMLYVMARYSSLSTQFWICSTRWNANAVLLFLVIGMTLVIVFDMMYPFSFPSAFVCAHCLVQCVSFAWDGRRFCPTIPEKCTRRSRKRLDECDYRSDNRGERADNTRTYKKKKACHDHRQPSSVKGWSL